MQQTQLQSTCRDKRHTTKSSVSSNICPVSLGFKHLNCSCTLFDSSRFAFNVATSFLGMFTSKMLHRTYMRTIHTECYCVKYFHSDFRVFAIVNSFSNRLYHAKQSLCSAPIILAFSCTKTCQNTIFSEMPMPMHTHTYSNKY